MKFDYTHLIFLADIHFGVHQNTEEWQNNIKDYFFNFFIPFVNNQKSTFVNNKYAVYILGDVFNDRKTIDINVFNAAIDCIEAVAKICPVIIINGNHDLSKRTNESNTSLRSLEYLNNVTVIKNVENIWFNNVKTTAIPYLGSIDDENTAIQRNPDSKYFFMHTEVTGLKMDNGSPITAGVNISLAKGRIFSGHIHRRQETNKAVYVGSPYHTSRGDIGDVKGVYVLDVKTGSLNFTANNYSPIYQNININDIISMSDDEMTKLCKDNYNYIIINEDELPKIMKKLNIYTIADKTQAKCAKPVIVKNKTDNSIVNDEQIVDKTIDTLIVEQINELDIDDDSKNRLIKLTRHYYTDALTQME